MRNGNWSVEMLLEDHQLLSVVLSSGGYFFTNKPPHTRPTDPEDAYAAIPLTSQGQLHLLLYLQAMAATA